MANHKRKMRRRKKEKCEKNMVNKMMKGRKTVCYREKEREKKR